MPTIATWNIGSIRITSHGNGWAYEIEEVDDGVPVRRVWLDGDDALQFRDELDAAPDAGDFLLDVLDTYASDDGTM